MKTYVYDSEVYWNLFAIGLMSLDKKETHLFVLCEDKGIDQIDEFKQFVDSHNGEITLIGHNSLNFDDPIARVLWEYPNNINNASLKRLANKIIKDKDFRHSDIYKQLSWYAEKRWVSYDTMELTRVNRNNMALKFAGVLLKYHTIEDLPYEPERILTSDEIDHVINYMMEGDLNLTLVLWNAIQEEVKIRHDTELVYGIDVHTSDRTGVGKAVFNKYYTERSGLSIKQLRELLPDPPDFIQLKNCISKSIKFVTPEFQKVYDEIANKRTFRINNYGYKFKFTVGGITYKLGIGGLHSDDFPAKFETTEHEIIREADGTSYYPFEIITNGFRPKHLTNIYNDIVEDITHERTDAKELGKSDPYYAGKAQSLKITINAATFGLLGYNSSYNWLYSPETLLSVTISGQLHLLDLIEKLYLIDIPTISANTDGIVVKLPIDREKEYFEVCQKWEQRTKIQLEYTDYNLYVRRDVNNYLTIKSDGKVKVKGIFNPGKFNKELQRWMPELGKGYDSPITAIAMYKHFIEGISIEDTIYNHTDLYDFMIAKKIDIYKYQPTLWTVENGEIVGKELQKTNRFLVTLSGGSFEKSSMKEGLNSTSIAAGQRVTIVNKVESEDVKDYDINYEWYISETRKTLDQIEPREIMLF